MVQPFAEDETHRLQHGRMRAVSSELVRTRRLSDTARAGRLRKHHAPTGEIHAVEAESTEGGDDLGRTRQSGPVKRASPRGVCQIEDPCSTRHVLEVQMLDTVLSMVFPWAGQLASEGADVSKQVLFPFLNGEGEFHRDQLEQLKRTY